MKTKYTIVYSGSYYWLYDESTNTLIMKTQDEAEAKELKELLEQEELIEQLADIETKEFTHDWDGDDYNE